MPTARFRRLYFDTSALISSNWPKISAGLERVVELCHLFKVDLFLPKPVEDELEVYWIETFRDKCRKIQSANDDLKRYITDIVKSDWQVSLPDETAGTESYRKTAQQVLEKWKIQPIPLTARSIDEVFKFAVQHHAPFAKDDKGFKDAVILMSVIDHLAKDSSITGAFLSGDKIFRDAKVGDLAQLAGVSLATYSNTDDLYNELAGWLEGVMKAAWEKDKQRAEESIKRRIPDIEQFLRESFEVSENEFGLGSRVVGVQSVKVNAIRNVRTPPLSEREKDEPVKISFEAQIELDAVVEQTYIPPPPSKLKVGERGPKYEGWNLAAILSGPVQQERTLPWIAEIEATASSEDEGYQNIKFVSVRSKGMSLRDRMVGLTLESLLAREGDADTT